MSAILVAFAVTLPSVLTAAEPAAWRIVNGHDGDTLTAIDPANVEHRVRLHGIDAPELKQAFGTKARDRLARLAKGKTAAVNVEGHDKYGRVFADIQIDGDDLGRRLVEEGMAWHYTRFDKSPALASAQRDAKAVAMG